VHTRYRAIARVEKTHGKKGEVVTVPVHGLPPMLREGLEVFPVPPALKGPRSRIVREADEGRTGQLVSLEGVDDINCAASLVGKVLLARIDDLPDDLAMHDVDALLDREVIDERHGSLGTLDEVMVGPANDVWVVRGAWGEVLIPVVDAVVLDVPAEGALRVRVPEGILDGGA
jgi:16S rRNA processing protein RimM